MSGCIKRQIQGTCFYSGKVLWRFDFCGDLPSTIMGLNWVRISNMLPNRTVRCSKNWEVQVRLEDRCSVPFLGAVRCSVQRTLIFESGQL